MPAAARQFESVTRYVVCAHCLPRLQHCSIAVLRRRSGDTGACRWGRSREYLGRLAQRSERGEPRMYRPPRFRVGCQPRQRTGNGRDELMGSIRERLESLIGSAPAKGDAEGASVAEAATREEHLGTKVVVTPPHDHATEPSRWPEDWSDTLDTVHRAAEALRAREDRIRALEGELGQVRDESSETVAALRAHVASLQEQLASVDERRAHVERWLTRLHDTILERLTPNSTVQGNTSRLTG